MQVFIALILVMNALILCLERIHFAGEQHGAVQPANALIIAPLQVGVHP